MDSAFGMWSYGSVFSEFLLWSVAHIMVFWLCVVVVVSLVMECQSRKHLGGRINIMFALFGGRVVRHGNQLSPPMEGVLKFNVDGAARDKPGLVRCGGVLRDCHGRILAFFSGPIGVVDSNETELQAICHALSILIEFNLHGVCMVIIESDSKVVVSWHIFREANSMVDCLAKIGVDRRSWLRVF
ncbi:hypothetical protein GQ457_15G019250 [Hibiscus cannabinus]